MIDPDWSRDWSRVVLIGSDFESTPEGLYLADRLRSEADAALATLTPDERDLVCEIERWVDSRMFGLEP